MSVVGSGDVGRILSRSEILDLLSGRTRENVAKNFGELVRILHSNHAIASQQLTLDLEKTLHSTHSLESRAAGFMLDAMRSYRNIAKIKHENTELDTMQAELLKEVAQASGAVTKHKLKADMARVASQIESNDMQAAIIQDRAQQRERKARIALEQPRAVPPMAPEPLEFDPRLAFRPIALAVPTDSPATPIRPRFVRPLPTIEPQSWTFQPQEPNEFETEPQQEIDAPIRAAPERLLNRLSAQARRNYLSALANIGRFQERHNLTYPSLERGSDYLSESQTVMQDLVIPSQEELELLLNATSTQGFETVFYQREGPRAAGTIASRIQLIFNLLDQLQGREFSFIRAQARSIAASVISHQIPAGGEQVSLNFYDLLNSSHDPNNSAMGEFMRNFLSLNRPHQHYQQVMDEAWQHFTQCWAKLNTMLARANSLLSQRVEDLPYQDDIDIQHDAMSELTFFDPALPDDGITPDDSISNYDPDEFVPEYDEVTSGEAYFDANQYYPVGDDSTVSNFAPFFTAPEQQPISGLRPHRAYYQPQRSQSLPGRILTEPYYDDFPTFNDVLGAPNLRLIPSQKEKKNLWSRLKQKFSAKD